MSSEEQPTSRNHLDIWVIYRNPQDFPNSTLARRREIRPGEDKPTQDVIFAPLEDLRDRFRYMGLYPIPRSPGDVESIVESWL